MLTEHFLHRVQGAIRGGESLDRDDGGSIGLQSELGAGFDRDAVDVDDAGAALAGVAADMGAGQSEFFAQQFDEQRAGLDLDCVLLAVNRQGDLRHCAPFP